MSWNYYPPKPSVASLRQAAKKKARALQKKDNNVQPVEIEGRKIVTTFWGKAWCDNLQAYHDFANRLPRGRSYVLNCAVVDLRIEQGQIKATLMGSSEYSVRITIAPLKQARWQNFKDATSGQISSAIALLKGELPDDVLERIVDHDAGLFPSPKEISMRCNCPDSARMCKHIAAAMYGVGHRLDSQPELLFKLRKVDQSELLQQAIGNSAGTASDKPQIADKHLQSIFGVKITSKPSGIDDLLNSIKRKKPATATAKKTLKKKLPKKKTAKKKVLKKKLKKKTAKKKMPRQSTGK